MIKQNMQDKISHILMSEYLLDISPDLHRTCIEAVKPLLEDEKHIPTIFNYVLHKQDNIFNTENAHFFLAVIYRIYSPIHLYTKECRLRNGIRSIITEVFNYKIVQMVNYFAGTVPPHYKNPRWAVQVNDLAFEIVENIKSKIADNE